MLLGYLILPWDSWYCLGIADIALEELMLLWESWHALRTADMLSKYLNFLSFWKSLGGPPRNRCSLCFSHWDPFCARHRNLCINLYFISSAFLFRLHKVSRRSLSNGCKCQVSRESGFNKMSKIKINLKNIKLHFGALFRLLQHHAPRHVDLHQKLYF